MLFTKILLIATLLLVFVQDLRYRAVNWLFFPVLALLYILYHFFGGMPFTESALNTLYNMLFLSAVFLLVWLYFMVTRGKMVYLPDRMIGWGDILFLTGICFYFSLLNFVFFYTISLLVVMLVWPIWAKVGKKARRQIPLAGLQSLILIVFFLTDWCDIRIDLTHDDWLLYIFLK